MRVFGLACLVGAALAADAGPCRDFTEGFEEPETLQHSGSFNVWRDMNLHVGGQYSARLGPQSDSQIAKARYLAVLPPVSRHPAYVHVSVAFMKYRIAYVPTVGVEFLSSSGAMCFGLSPAMMGWLLETLPRGVFEGIMEGYQTHAERAVTLVFDEIKVHIDWANARFEVYVNGIPFEVRRLAAGCTDLAEMRFTEGTYVDDINVLCNASHVMPPVGGLYGGSGGGGGGPLTILLIVGCSLAGVVLLAVAACVVVRLRRRREAQKKPPPRVLSNDPVAVAAKCYVLDRSVASHEMSDCGNTVPGGTILSGLESATFYKYVTSAVGAPSARPDTVGAPFVAADWVGPRDVALRGFVAGREIGRGAYGVVRIGYAAPLAVADAAVSPQRAQRLREFAVKETCGELTEETARESVEQLELLRSLPEHVNVVQYFDVAYSLQMQTLCTFMEYVDGMSLAELMDLRAKEGRGRLPEDDAAGYTAQILRGLLHLHNHGVVHRDVKAANVLLSSVGGFVKLCDFGCLKNMEGAASGSGTVVNTLVGSPNWMAPEVVAFGHHANKCGPSSDIYSVGCTVSEILNEGVPPGPASGNVWQVIAKLQVQSGLPENIVRGASAEAAEFITQCMQLDPMSRPTSEALLTHPFVTGGHLA